MTTIYLVTVREGSFTSEYYQSGRTQKEALASFRENWRPGAWRAGFSIRKLTDEELRDYLSNCSHNKELSNVLHRRTSGG